MPIGEVLGIESGLNPYIRELNSPNNARFEFVECENKNDKATDVISYFLNETDKLIRFNFVFSKIIFAMKEEFKIEL